MNKLTRALLALAACGAANLAAAAPTIVDTRFFADRWGPSAVFPTLNGDYLHLFTTVLSPDAPAQISAVATQGALVRPLNFFTGPIFAPKNFERYLTNTALTGAWNLTVTDSSGTATGTFAAIANPQFLPLLQNLQVSGSGTTPTVTWTVPDLTGFDADDIRVRAVDSADSSQVFESASLPLSSASLVIPSGVLQTGHTYVFRILLDDFDGQRLENRSNTFSGAYAVAVPESSTCALLLAGLGVLAAGVRRRR